MSWLVTHCHDEVTGISQLDFRLYSPTLALCLLGWLQSFSVLTTICVDSPTFIRLQMHHICQASQQPGHRLSQMFCPEASVNSVSLAPPLHAQQGDLCCVGCLCGCFEMRLFKTQTCNELLVMIIPFDRRV